MSIVRNFLKIRHNYLNEITSLRSSPVAFDKQKTDELAREMGRLEMRIATLEAQVYRKIRDSMTELAKSQSIHWTVDLLDEFLTNPKMFAPGTKMEFQGLLSSQDRQAIIQHLKTNR